MGAFTQLINSFIVELTTDNTWSYSMDIVYILTPLVIAFVLLALVRRDE
jgi:hypothetical protein